MPTSIRESHLVKATPYRSLEEPDSIRLILLAPSSVKSEDLRCNLIHTTLLRCENEIIDHYIALSYVWGDAREERTIWIDDVPFIITANLHAALSDLRDDTRNLRLWVDAICINQKNDDEKGKQVALMGRIYATASHTVIYLGPLEHKLEELLGTMVPSDYRTVSGPRSYNSTSRLAVAELILTKAWFRRVWIFQELIFSRDPWIQYGKYRWTWDRLYQFLAETRSSLSLNVSGSTEQNLDPEGSSELLVGEVDDNARQGYAIISEMHLAHENHLQKTGPNIQPSRVTLLDLLQARRGLGATDSRGMIYALTGFASDGHTVTADYTKTCKTLYEDFARFQIHLFKDHSILSHVGNYMSPTRPQGLASWAPDWSNPKPTYPLPCFADEKNREIFWEDHVWIKSSSTLACKGYGIDRITHISTPLMTLKIQSQKENEFRSRFAKLQKDYDGGEHEGGRSEIILRTRDLCHDIHNFWSNLVNDENILQSIPIRNGRKLAPHGDFRTIFDTAFRRSPDKSGRSKEHDRYRLSTGLFGCTIDLLMQYFYPGCDKNFINGRALARMESGKLALVPGYARVGDISFRLLPHPTENASFLVRPKLEAGSTTTDFSFDEEALSSLVDAKHIGWSWSKTLQWLSTVTAEEYVFLSCSFLGDCWLDVAEPAENDINSKGLRKAIFAME